MIGALAGALVAAGAGRLSLDAGFTKATGVALAPDSVPADSHREEELVGR
jgi:hypothetical protein